MCAARVDLPRNRPAVELMRILLGREAEVSYRDPFVPEVRLDEESRPISSPVSHLRPMPLSEDVLSNLDCVCLAVAHSAFDIPWVMKHSRLILDVTVAARRFSSDSGTVVRL